MKRLLKRPHFHIGCKLGFGAPTLALRPSNHRKCRTRHHDDIDLAIMGGATFNCVSDGYRYRIRCRDDGFPHRLGKDRGPAVSVRLLNESHQCECDEQHIADRCPHDTWLYRSRNVSFECPRCHVWTGIQCLLRRTRTEPNTYINSKTAGLPLMVMPSLVMRLFLFESRTKTKRTQ